MKSKQVTGTREWSDATMDCYAGCENACKYCYAQSRKIQLRAMTPETRSVPVKRDWDNFVSAFKTIHRKMNGNGTLMFPSTHDISPGTLEYCLETLKYMLGYEDSKYTMLIVSKPWMECIRRICTEMPEYKDRMLFRFTIGSADDAVLRFWEPGAPAFQERLECLRHAVSQGYATSVSCEPMLDGHVENVVDAVYPYVTETIWLGYPNNLETRLKWNGFGDAVHVEAAAALRSVQTEGLAKAMYDRWGADPKIRWKDSLKKILRLQEE